MRVSRGAVAALVVAGLLGGVAAGCGGDDDDSGEATTEAPTTTAAPATTAPPATTTAPATTAAPAGDVAAGEAFFAQTCTGCHLENGTAAGGTGPKLEGLGLTEQRIRDQVMNGGGAMPAGLAQGQDLDNVTAYVLSIQ